MMNVTPQSQIYMSPEDRLVVMAYEIQHQDLEEVSTRTRQREHHRQADVRHDVPYQQPLQNPCGNVCKPVNVVALGPSKNWTP